MSTWLICGGGPRTSRCNSCRKVHNLLQDPEYPLSAQRESDSPAAPPDEELEINTFRHKVTKTGPPCSFCGFKGHKGETCYRKHPQLRPPAGAKKRGLKKGPPLQGLWQHLVHPGSVLKTPSTLEAPAKESCQAPHKVKLEA